MSAGLLRNSVNKFHYHHHHLWHKHSIADTIGAPITRIHHWQQPSQPYSRFPHSIYRRAKELNLSVPNVLLSSRYSSTETSNSKIAFVGWYLGMIKSRPILTKSITSALIYTAADLSSQVWNPSVLFIKSNSNSSFSSIVDVTKCAMVGFGDVEFIWKN